MAAWDTFTAFMQSLTDHERELLADLIAAARQDLFAARSEEARVHIVEDLMRSAREAFRSVRR
ncbi:MAG: hypothetical protein AB1428_13245 [Bacteroidota bacterium]